MYNIIMSDKKILDEQPVQEVQNDMIMGIKYLSVQK